MKVLRLASVATLFQMFLGRLARNLDHCRGVQMKETTLFFDKLAIGGFVMGILILLALLNVQKDDFDNSLLLCVYAAATSIGTFGTGAALRQMSIKTLTTEREIVIYPWLPADIKWTKTGIRLFFTFRFILIYAGILSTTVALGSICRHLVRADSTALWGIFGGVALLFCVAISIGADKLLIEDLKANPDMQSADATDKDRT
jgi:hypothetical protein